METLLNAVNDLADSIGTFKKDQDKKWSFVEKKLFNDNRLSIPGQGGLTGDDIYKKDFCHYLAKGIEPQLSPDYLTKSLSSREDSGGFLIPQALHNRLHQKLEEHNPMRRLCAIKSIGTASLDLLFETKGADAGWVEETAERAETESPELRKVRIPVHELYAKPRVTERLLTDSNIDVEEWLLASIGETFGKKETLAFIYGDGNHKPRGFLSYDRVAKDDWRWDRIEHMKTGNINAYGEHGTDRLIDVMGSLKSPYHQRAAWVMSRSALSMTQKLTDGEGRYIVQQGHATDQRPSIFGYPVEVIDAMPGVLNAEAPCVIAFGDFKEAYQIVEHEGTYVLRDPYSAKPFVEFYTTKRVGGDIINSEAIKLLSFTE